VSDGLTPNYQLNQPEVGGSSGTWGDKLDADVALIDTLLGMPRPVRAVSTTGALDLSAGLVQYLNVNGDKTVSFTNVPVAESGGEDVATLVYLLVNTGGAHDVDYDTSVAWIGSGTAPELSTDGLDMLLFFTNDEGATWSGIRLSGDVTEQQLAPAVQTKINSRLAFFKMLSDVSHTGTGYAAFGTIVVPGGTIVADQSLVRITMTGKVGTSPGTPYRIKFGSTVLHEFTPSAGNDTFTFSIILTPTAAATQEAIATVTSETDGLAVSHSSPTETLSGDITVSFETNAFGNTNVMYSASVEVLTNE